MTRKGEFVLRQLADEYILIPYGTTTEKNESGTYPK